MKSNSKLKEIFSLQDSVTKLFFVLEMCWHFLWIILSYSVLCLDFPYSQRHIFLVSAIFLNRYPVQNTDQDIDISPTIVGKRPMDVKWYHQGREVLSEPRTIYTEYMSTIPQARYGLYQLKVKNSHGESMAQILFLPDLEDVFYGELWL